MTDAVKPLACPFCGAEAKVRHRSESSVFIECGNESCDVRPMANVGSYAASLRIWNRRTPPAGWKLVPVEPTEKMIDAGLDYFKDYFSEGGFYVGNEGVKYSYKTIIEAAPENDDER